MGIGPVLLLFRIDSDGLGSMEPMASGVLPHYIGTVGYEPTAFHPTGHADTEVHPDVVVQGPVVLGSVRAEGTISVVHFPEMDFPWTVIWPFISTFLMDAMLTMSNNPII